MSATDIRWIVQQNLGNARDLGTLTRSFEALGVAWQGLDVIPFDDTPPDVSTEGRVIFYGSTTLIANVARSGRWRPGVFFREERFTFEALLAGYGDALLNADSEVVTVGELVERTIPDDALYFVRPAADLKEFTGDVMTFADIRQWRENLAGSAGPLSLATRVQIAAPKRVHQEWRVIMVGGRAVTASRYRRGGRLDPSPEVPREVTDYADQVASRWQPEPVFTLDVGETDAGLCVVETNCFNSSGFYRCDVRAAVRAVTAWIARNVPG